jgi:uncharacterized C2H2 Zn-finger protein
MEFVLDDDLSGSWLNRKTGPSTEEKEMWSVYQQTEGEIADEVPSVQQSKALWIPHNPRGEREQSSSGDGNLLVYRGPRLELSDPIEPITPYTDCSTTSSATLHCHLEHIKPPRTQEQIHEPASCPSCGKVFKGIYASGNLIRHKKSLRCASSHKRRREWPCGSCDKVYQRSDALLKHLRKNHGALDALTERSVKSI